MAMATADEEEMTLGARVTSEEKATLSTYIGVGVAVLLILGGLYFLFFARTKTAEVMGFDPHRPVPTDEVLRRRLNPSQYRVARENGTEAAFQNEYWSFDRAGIYVDVITGEPLFASTDKYDAGNGRPTFSKPISKDSIAEKMDTSFDMQRTEIHSKLGNSHLGHLFPDPKSPTGQRYAVNSAALRFIPREQMSSVGYSSYRTLLDGQK
jgi:peptide-methionine (R)-S-oxide reductase